MIQADDLTIAYQGDPLFESLSFSIQKGEKCALVGRNGSGKTTLLKLLAGQEEPDAGTMSFPKGYRLGYLQQHIHFTHSTALEEAISALPQELQEETYRAAAILFGLGFNDTLVDLPPKQLSGGFSLRLNLAKVLLADPDCLLLDEPTNYLDLPSIRWLTRFLKDWKKEAVVISHDREFLDGMITHTMGLHRKQLYKIRGKTADLFNLIAQEEEVHEKTRQKTEKLKAHAQKFIERFGAKATKAAQAQSRQKMIDRLPSLEKLAEIYNLKFSFNEAPFFGKKLLEASHLRFSYSHATLPLIADFSLTIENQQRLAIIGKNGYGKSTLLRLLAQDLKPISGVLKMSENASIGYFGQTHIQHLQGELTIEEEIALANPALSFTDVRSICGQMMFTKSAAEKKIKVLSGGEKSRVLLGKIIAKKCNLLLLDEPTHHLDIESIEALMEALEEFRGSVVMVTHSELILNRLQTNQIIFCEENQQSCFTGTYEAFLEDIGWPDEKKASPAKPVKQEPQKDPKRGLRSKIKKLEEEIAQLEKSLKEHQELLLQATLDRKPLQPYLKKVAEEEKRLQQLYQDWEKASEEWNRSNY